MRTARMRAGIRAGVLAQLMSTPDQVYRDAASLRQGVPYDTHDEEASLEVFRRVAARPCDFHLDRHV